MTEFFRLLNQICINSQMIVHILDYRSPQERFNDMTNNSLLDTLESSRQRFARYSDPFNVCSEEYLRERWLAS